MQAQQEPTGAEPVRGLPRLERSDLWIALGLVLVCWFAYSPLLDYFRSGLEDEGDTVYSAWRMVEGQAPYLDYVVGIPPGSLVILAAWMKLVGASLGAVRLLAIAIHTGSVLLVYLIGLFCTARPGAALAALVFALTSFTKWPIVSYHWFGTAGLLLTVPLVLAMLRAPKTLYPFAAGAAAGLTFAQLQTDGAIAGVACFSGAFLVWRRCGLPVFLRTCGLGVAGWFAGALPFFGLVALRAGASQVFQDTVGVYFGSNRQVSFQKMDFQFFPWQTVKAGWAGLSWEAAMAQKVATLDFATWPLVHFLTHSLFYPLSAVFVVLALGFYWRSPKEPTAEAMVVLGFANGISCLATLYRPSAVHITFVRHLWWVLGIGFVVIAASRWRALKLAAPVVGGLLATLIIVHGGLFHRRFTFTKAFHVVVLPQGRVRTANPALAANLRQMQKILSANTQPSDKIFAYPIFPMLYFLTGLHNATPRERVIAVWLSDDQLRQLIADLYKDPPKFLIMLDYDYPTYLAGYPYIDPQEFITKDRAFRAALAALSVPTIKLLPKFEYEPQ